MWPPIPRYSHGRLLISINYDILLMSLKAEHAQSDVYHVHTFVSQMATACCDEYLCLGCRAVRRRQYHDYRHAFWCPHLSPDVASQIIESRLATSHQTQPQFVSAISLLWYGCLPRDAFLEYFPGKKTRRYSVVKESGNLNVIIYQLVIRYICFRNICSVKNAYNFESF